MSNIVITIEYVRLTEDHIPNENCFFPEGSEGVIIDMHTIGLLPNLSKQEYSDIAFRERLAKEKGAYFVLINGRLVTISSLKLEFVRSDPARPIFEDDADREQYADERLEEIMKQCLGDNKNASA